MMEFRLKGKGSMPSIIVRCPECGEEGHLVKERNGFYAYKYKVNHYEGKRVVKVCSIPPQHPRHKEVDAVYRLVRQGVVVR
ncbi:MAG: hypothetical protein ACXQS4_02550 [Methermicoccaceae archaeon]